MSQDKPVLTVEKIEAWRKTWRNTYQGNSAYQEAFVQLDALCDLALSALERQGSGKWVPRDIHPLDNSHGDAVIQLLAHPPSAARFSDPNDYYDHWWGLLLDAASPQAQDAQTGEGFRACGMCGVRDIPFGVEWGCWHDGRPCHPACYPINEPPQVTGSSEHIKDSTSGPASGSPDMLELAMKAVEAQRNDTRTEAEIVADGVKFIMGPDGDEGTRPAPSQPDIAALVAELRVEANAWSMWKGNYTGRRTAELESKAATMILSLSQRCGELERKLNERG